MNRALYTPMPLLAVSWSQPRPISYQYSSAGTAWSKTDPRQYPRRSVCHGRRYWSQSGRERDYLR
jgi:hypothetical protein